MPSQKKTVEVLKGKRLSEQVYDALERRIIRGMMAPGSHIAEEKIAREFGISRSPVRQAIAALEVRGLAEWAGKRDRRVSIPSTAFVADVFDTCSVLESGRVYHSCRVAPPEDHAELVACLQHMETMRARGNKKEYEKNAGLLREILVRRCDNQKLNQLSREFDGYRKWIVAISYPTDLFESEEEHKRIVQCYIARDRVGLMEAIELHASHIKKAILEAFERQRELFKAKLSRSLARSRNKRGLQGTQIAVD